MTKAARSQMKLTASDEADCPAEDALRSITGKWKPRIIRLGVEGPLRFNALMRELPGSNRQAITNALRELTADGLLLRTEVALKPLHVEYTLTAKGRSMIALLRALEPE